MVGGASEQSSHAGLPLNVGAPSFAHLAKDGFCTTHNQPANGSCPCSRFRKALNGSIPTAPSTPAEEYRRPAGPSQCSPTLPAKNAKKDAAPGIMAAFILTIEDFS
jgi:hypothetical protein